MLLADQQIDLSAWRDLLRERGEPLDVARLAKHVHADHLPHAVLIDCTASDDVAATYASWLESGLHVITPNKRANTASLDYYTRLRRANRSVGAHYLYETTVGAALPIMQTLRDLVQTGDDVSRSKAFCRARCRTCSTVSTARSPFRRSCDRLAISDTPSPIRVTISRGPTSRARS